MTDVVPVRSRASLGLLILFAFLVLAAYANPLFFRRNFAGRDLAVYNLPMEFTIHEAYSQGELPLWSPEISGGRPLLPNPNAGALYPVRPLLARLPFPAAMRLFPLIHWIAAGSGMLLLLRLLGSSRGAAWVGAVAYVFSGVGVAQVFYPNLQPGMSLLPWIVWAFARRSDAPVRILTLSVTFGLLFLAGDVFATVIAIGACLLWLFAEEASLDRPRLAGQLVAALLLALLLALPQVLATALWVPETTRAVSGLKLREALFFSISPFRLLELVVPYPFGQTWALDDSAVWGWPVFRFKSMGMFTTLYAGGIAVVALFTRWRSRVRGVRFARLLFGICTAAAVIPSFLPRGWETVQSPLPLRNPEKFAFGVGLALALLSGLAVDETRRTGHRPRGATAVLVGLGLLAITAHLFPHAAGSAAVALVGAPERSLAVAGRVLPGALAEGGLLWGLTILALHLLTRPGRSATAVACLLLALAPILANRRIARTLREEEALSPTPLARFLQKKDPTASYRTLGEGLYFPSSKLEVAALHAQPELPGVGWLQFRHALWHRGTVFNRDVDVADFSRVESLRRGSAAVIGSRNSAAFFGNLSLRWGLRFRDQPAVSGYRAIRRNADEQWDELSSALPDVRLLEAWREELTPLDALKMSSMVELGEGVLETGRRGAGRARPGSARTLGKTTGHLVVQTDAPDPTWLFVLRGYWRHRRVTLDGKPVSCFPAQVAFSAVPIPAGRHIVDWKEQLPGAKISRWGPPAFAACAIALAAARRSRGST